MKHREKGFTIIELMIVIAIISILGMITVPNLFSWRERYNFRAAADDFYIHLQKARITAIKRGAPCTILFNANGYDIFEDSVLPRLAFNSGDSYIERVTWSGRNNIKYDTRQGGGAGRQADVWDTSGHTFSTATLTGLTFWPDGIVRNSSGSAPGGGTIWLSCNAETNTRKFTVTLAGSVRVDGD